jgi:predicted DNA-binding protein (MmcQ/YjbR family)
MNIELLQDLCRSLPSATEDVKWENDLCFSVGQKMFCVASLEPPLRISFKVSVEDFETVCAREGFMPAPYLARARWVTVINSSKVKSGEWPELIRKSYDLVVQQLPKKLRNQLGITNL